MDGKILIFEVTDPALLEKIRLAMGLCQVEVRVVERGEYHQSIGVLAGIPGGKLSGSGMEMPLPEPMMVLCLPQSRLDGVLAALRGIGVPPMAKAMLTPTNAGWLPAQLLAELRRERAEFAKMGVRN